MTKVPEIHARSAGYIVDDLRRRGLAVDKYLGAVQARWHASLVVQREGGPVKYAEPVEKASVNGDDFAWRDGFLNSGGSIEHRPQQQWRAGHWDGWGNCKRYRHIE